MAETKKVKVVGDFSSVKKGLKDTEKGFAGAGKGTKLFAGSVKMVGTAMKAMGIGAIVALLGMLVDALMKNQKVMDAFNKIMIVVAQAIGFVVDVIETMVNALKSVTDWLGITSSEGESFADSLVAQRNAVTLLEAELEGVQLKYQQQAEVLRQQRDDEQSTIDDRIKANQELGQLLEQQFQVEIEMANEKIRLAEMELELDGDNVEMQANLIRAKNKLLEIDERITSQRSEQLTNLNSLERERTSNIKDASRAREDARKKEQQQMEELIATLYTDVKAEELSMSLIAQKTRLEENYMKALEEVGAIQKKTNKDAKEGHTHTKEGLAKLIEENEYYVKEVQEYWELLQGAEKSGNETMIMLRQDNFDKINTMANEHNDKMVEYQEKFLSGEKTYNELTFTANKKAKKKQEELTENYNIALEKIQLQAQEVIRQHFLTDQEREIEAVKEKYETLIGYAVEGSMEQLTLRAELQDKLDEIDNRELQELHDFLNSRWDILYDAELSQEQLELQALDDKYAKIEEKFAGNQEALAKIQEMKENEMTDVKTKHAKLRTDVEKAELEMGLQALAGAMGTASGLMKEGSEEYKAFASMETIIATYLAATKAMEEVPFPFNFVAAGSVIASGIVNLKNILSAKPGDTISGGDNPRVPTDNNVDDNSFSQVPSLDDSISNTPPVQAFVVESDVSNAQALQDDLTLQSTL